MNELTDVLENIEYLSRSTTLSNWPVTGQIVGLHKMCVVCLPTRLSDEEPLVNVFYVVDPGAPSTELSSSAFTALSGMTMALPRVAKVNINNVVCPVSVAGVIGTRHGCASVLGADFLSLMHAKVITDYVLHTVVIEKGA
jgi:hypothetical protein